jgi:hypothetical protein
MTRELLFSTSFEPQLAAFTLWNSLISTQGALAQTLAPSDMPGFELIPGEARYTTYDSFGHPTGGVQSFTLRVHFSHPQLAISTMRATRSPDVSLIESFFVGAYTPPTVSTGDTARIDSITLLTIDPAILSKTATRSSITAHAEYAFTLF